MARVEITLPDRLPFATEMQVRITDVNYGGHLGNDTVLSLVHEARVRFFASLGCSELSFFGVGTTMTDSAIRYLSEGRYGQRLAIRVGASDLTRRGFDLYYEIVDAGTGKPVAVAKTGIVAYDYGAKRICRLPEAAAERLRAR